MDLDKKGNFPTKAETLKMLKEVVKKSRIEPLILFTYSFWKNNEKIVLNKIKERFKGGRIIVRSSAINEDKQDNSMAGQFKSILNVSSKNKEEVREAINGVFQSYKKKKSLSSFNQVFVQKQVTDIAMSGVVFTKSLLHNAPYYIINYDSSTGSSNSVTAGFETKTIKISKSREKQKIPEEFKKLIGAVQEIEAIAPEKGLDIEFAIDKKGKIIIFQVRQLTIKKQINEKGIKKRIICLEKQYAKLSKTNVRTLGERKIFADMPDWNPAEILGDDPGYLDFSLYDYIITKDAWYEARISQGYNAGSPSRLVYLFGNKPYVDVGSSFSSFVPNFVSERLRDKLILFYLDKLRKHPELQDKVEFEILYTCYDLSFKERSQELIKAGFDKQEVEELKSALINLTNNLITNFKKDIEVDLRSLEEMKKSREKIKFSELSDHVLSSLNCAKILLDDCRKKGTIQFSKLARLAFIGKILLKSLVKTKIIDAYVYDSFMESIRTVTTEFEEDFELMKRKKLSKEKFIKKYYHLRPGTYDITSKRYESNISLIKTPKLQGFKRKIKKKFKLKPNLAKKINITLHQSGLKFNAKNLFEFIRSAIEAREFSKFEFTKNLSDAIELIALAGGEMGFSREELAYLGVKDLFFQEGQDKNELVKKWRKVILQRKKERVMNSFLELPPIIFSDKDFRIIRYYSPKPNYITQKRVISKTSKLNKNCPEVSKIDEKIVLLENGDPGYDWIFTRKPSGLITKYGGVASHMAIRCAEFGIPAAIGCGILFDKLEDNSKIVLDCRLKKIVPMGVQ